MNKNYKQMYEEQKNMSSAERTNYQNEQRNNAIDQKTMRFIENGVLDLFIAGAAGARFPEEDGLAFTNAGIVLSSIYRVYLKYPDMRIDILFEEALIKLLNKNVGELYTALNTINSQLYFEQNGVAPFKLNNPDLFVILKQKVKQHEEFLKTSTSYRGKLYNNNLYGFVEEIGDKIEQQKGVKIL